MWIRALSRWRYWRRCCDRRLRVLPVLWDRKIQDVLPGLNPLKNMYIPVIISSDLDEKECEEHKMVEKTMDKIVALAK